MALTISEAVSVLRVSRNTLYRMARDGEVATVRYAHRLWVPRGEVLRLLGLEAT